MINLLLGFYLFCPLVHFDTAQWENHPRKYVAYKTAVKPLIDGRLNETIWETAPSSDPFVDIRGEGHSLPKYLTQMKMIWDNDHLYIGLRMEEPHLWATYTERESVIFHENDIEIFMDPDGDTHHYYELEINALGTIWDLMLTKPYRNGGKPINGWNINNFKHAVHLEGSVNESSDLDEYWSVEMAIPWKSLSQSGPNFRPPKNREVWRINFSRVQWQLEPGKEGYQKKIEPKTGRPFPEDNWVWSPMGVVDMHLPARWGYVQFMETPVGEKEVSFEPEADEEIKNCLRKLYWAQKEFFQTHQRYAENLITLGVQTELEKVQFEVSDTRFKLSTLSHKGDKEWHIIENSKIWMD